MLTAAQRIQCSSSAFNPHQNLALAKILTNVPGVAYRAAPVAFNGLSSSTNCDLINFSLDGRNAITGLVVRVFASGQYTAPTSTAGDLQPKLIVSGVAGNSGLQPFPHLAPLASAGGAWQAWELHAHIYVQPVAATVVAPSLYSNQSGQPFYPQGTAGVFTSELKFNMSTQTNASAASNNVGGQQDATVSLIYKTKNPVPFQLGQTMQIDVSCLVKGVQFTMDIGYAEVL